MLNEFYNLTISIMSQISSNILVVQNKGLIKQDFFTGYYISEKNFIYSLIREVRCPTSFLSSKLIFP